MASALIVPTLVAGPWRLRPFNADDLALVSAASSDPAIPQITTVPAHFTEEAGRQYLERQADRAATGDGYSFAIADATDQGVGSIGLWLRQERDCEAAIGYWVTPAARGQGVASAALRSVRDWASGELHIPRLVLYIAVENHRSIRTAEAAEFICDGMEHTSRGGREPQDMLVYAFSRQTQR